MAKGRRCRIIAKKDLYKNDVRIQKINVGGISKSGNNYGYLFFRRIYLFRVIFRKSEFVQFSFQKNLLGNGKNELVQRSDKCTIGQKNYNSADHIQ